MTNLGDIVRTHQGTPWSYLRVAGGCALFVGAGCYGVSASKAPGTAALVIVGFALLMAFFIVLAVIEAAVRLELRERGLVYTRRGKARTLRYADIAHVVERRFNHKPSQVILELRGGGTFEIDAHLVDYDAAVQTIAGAV